ncbi:FAD-dependent oxidoreductase [Streptomyces zingiberis]|uniref:FAD-dependent monooxygenase n=1 Tax=Streptomyces zingiberis TaxID=2053010 RepID=A0ABX1C7X5_9ACTN|nr:NAD(P)/FAD-dependent oxidoreductase [Streptomyces zingiberis]NJQ03804.1 FAD-dependent monooxygenase [Streptomyces zingiberis]
MSEPRRRLRAVIVGAGPVGCLLAVELRRRDFEVEIYEKQTPAGAATAGSRRSFNLTLTLRGTGALRPALRDRVYAVGTVLTRRIVHHRDGSLTHQPYGVAPGHHLLSVPRAALQRILLEEARAAGATVHFGHACVAADPHRAEAVFVADGGGVRRASGDLLIGCDGANSAVRYELSKSGARMRIQQEYIPHGHVELAMRPGCARPLRPDGMHLWPRGDHFLQAQPNRDGTATTTLFMPVDSRAGELRFRAFARRAAVRGHFDREYPDIAPALPEVARDVWDARPALLKVVRCAPYHYGQAVLVGDAAHTIVPFFGQGINCSFEDTEVLCALLDRHLVPGADRRAAIRAAVAGFSEARVESGLAIADLSLANLRELSAHVDDERFHLRKALERRLHQRYPRDFTQLYQLVAFTRVPYDEIVRRSRRDAHVLDLLCERYDPRTQADEILASYPELARDPDAAEPVPVLTAGRSGPSRQGDL